MKREVRISMLAFLLVGIVFVLCHAGSVVQAILESRTWILDHGIAGVAIYFLMVVGVLQMMIPATTLELFAGFLFGFRVGAEIVCTAEVVASAINFLVARWCMRERVDRMLRGHPIWRALHAALATGMWRAVVLMRFAYLPLPLKNCALAALPEVPLSVCLGTMLFSETPITLIIVYIGSSLESIAQIEQGGKKGDPMQIVLVGILIIMNIILATAMMMLMRREVMRAETDSDSTERAHMEPLMYDYMRPSCPQGKGDEQSGFLEDAAAGGA